MKFLKVKISIAIIITVMIICLVLLIYLGLAVVRPYRYTIGFLQTQCTTVEVNRTADPPYGFEECVCINQLYGCSSVFPCVRIIVRYNSTDDGQEQEAIIFKDNKALDDELPCSYKPCKQSPMDNIVLVESFAETYGIQSKPFACYYNPEKLYEVLMEKPSRTTVVMVLVWPILIVVFCAVSIGIILFKAKI